MRSVRTIADKAATRVRNMIAEQTRHTGKRPTIIRVTLSDYLAMSEVGYVTTESKLSGDPHGLEVRPG